MLNQSIKLTDAQRHRLQDLLDQIAIFDNEGSRSLLLDPFQPELRTRVERSPVKTVDLRNIVRTAASWGILIDGSNPLLKLIAEAIHLSQGSQTARELEKLYKELEDLATPTTAHAFGPLQYAEIYRELIKAEANGEWQHVQELGRNIEGYSDVSNRLKHAEKELDALQPLIEEIGKAYASGDEIQAIKLAHQMNISASPDLVRLVVKAWSNVPIGMRALIKSNTPIIGMAVTPDGGQVIAATGQGDLKLWNIPSGQLVATLETLRRGLNPVVLTPDGRTVIYGWSIGLRVWNLSLNQEPSDILNRNADFMNCLAVTSDGQQILAGSSDGTLTLMGVASGETIINFPAHAKKVNAVATVPNNLQALSGSGDRTLKLWDLASTQEIHAFSGHSDSILSLGMVQTNWTVWIA